mgnify:CR=1 FL=1
MSLQRECDFRSNSGREFYVCITVQSYVAGLLLFAAAYARFMHMRYAAFYYNDNCEERQSSSG